MSAMLSGLRPIPVRSPSDQAPARDVGPCRGRPGVARSYHHPALSPHGRTSPESGGVGEAGPAHLS